MDRTGSPVLANALGDRVITIWLLDRGADPIRCDIDYTPLFHAVKYADLSIIYLLDCGDNVRKDQLLHNAIYRESVRNPRSVDLKRDDVIIYLVSKGANVNIENSKVKWPYEDTRSQISKIS
ncbi:hypothetical protein N7499_008198 [Penicillium canescens]|nr:hypothetical protein N7499_008198 [Penicillium canescens]